MNNWVKSNSSYLYRIPIRPGYLLCEHLGIVKPRGDGRWNWWRKPSQFHKWDTGQGVATTKQEAMEWVEEGWTPPVLVDYDPNLPTRCPICRNFIVGGDPTKPVKLRACGTFMVGPTSGNITVESWHDEIRAQDKARLSAGFFYALNSSLLIRVPAGRIPLYHP